eukprot:m.138846 g.138846  ORF g.138846 m.138846 type:complete len:297 (-) comp17274_c0_seq1:139-1029(-)
MWLVVLFIVVVVNSNVEVMGIGPGVVTVPIMEAKCPLVSTFYENRPAPEPLFYSRWVHIPKTGTSFGTALIHYACEFLSEDIYPHRTERNSGDMKDVMDKFYKPPFCTGVFQFHFAGHAPLRYSEREKGGVVTMLRDPRRRHYSGWQVHGRKGTPTHPEDLHDYVLMYKGCQMKMLLGEKCEFSLDEAAPDVWHPTSKQAERAVKLLGNRKIVAFVGLTDEWEASICLFHAMYGGFITHHEMLNTRPKAKIFDDGGWQQIHYMEDPYDWMVYMEAKRIFIHRLETYGIKVPASLHM